MAKARLSRPVRVAALLLTSVLGVGLGEARAGLGIEILDPPILSPVEDPLAQYDFKLILVANNQVLRNDFVTLFNIPSYNGVSRYVFTSGGIDYSQLFSIRATPGSSAGLTNLQLILTGSPGTVTNADLFNNLPIGDLLVETSVQFPPPGNSPLFDPISYASQTHIVSDGTLNSGTGITPRPLAVPEPSSLALMGWGGVALAGLAFGRGRGRPARPARSAAPMR